MSEIKNRRREKGGFLGQSMFLVVMFLVMATIITAMGKPGLSLLPFPFSPRSIMVKARN